MKALAGAEGNITAGITSAPNLPTKIHDDQPETMTRINQQIQHGQPTSNTKGAADSNNISSFLLVPELLHKCSSPVDTTQNHFNQPIQRGQSRSKTSSATDSGTPSFSFMDKLLQESTTVASTAQNNNNHQMQHEQPFSNTHGAADNIISSFSLMYGRVNEGSTLVDTAQNYNNQHIQHDQPFSNISSFLFMDEPLYECSTEASWAQNNNNQQIQQEQPFINISSFSLMHGTVDTAQNDINQQIESLHELSTLVDTTVQNDINQQIEPVQRSGNTSRGTADSCISSFSLLKKTLHEFSIPAGSVQDGTFPTSNAHSMPKKVESFSELIDVEKDYSMDYGILMEYPLRHSPECVLLKPVPGANTHPDYLWKKQQLGQLIPCSKK